MITTERTEYVALSAVDHAAEMGRALNEAQHALAAARQRLAAHTAQRPATAADVTAWARRKAELTAEIEGYEGLVSDARTHAQQAQAALRQQQTMDQRAAGMAARAVHEQTKVAIAEKMRALAVQMRALMDEGAAEDRRFQDEWKMYEPVCGLARYKFGSIYTSQLNYFEFQSDGNKVMAR